MNSYNTITFLPFLLAVDGLLCRCLRWQRKRKTKKMAYS